MAIEGKHLHLLAGLLVSFLALWISFRHVNFTLLFHLLWKGHYGWLVPILLLMNVSIFFRALFWRTTLSVVKRVSPFHLYSSIIVGYMANNILPFRGGEMVRLLYTRRIEKISSAILFSTIFLERFFDVVLLTVILFLFFLLHGASDIREKLFILGGATSTIFFALLLLVRFRSHFIRFLLGMTGRQPETLWSRMAQTMEKLLHGLSTLASPRHLLILFAMSFIVWAMSLGGCYFYLRIFDLDIHPVMMSLSLLLFTNLALVIPSSPGGIGVIQFATLYAMRIFGVGDEEALALSVIYQLVPFVFTTILGWTFIHRQHMSLFDRKTLDADSA